MPSQGSLSSDDTPGSHDSFTEVDQVDTNSSSPSSLAKAIEKFPWTAEFAVCFQAPLDIASMDTMVPISSCYDSISETAGVEHSLGIS
jgi:hypothetical protein